MQKTILAKVEGRLALGIELDTQVANIHCITAQWLRGLALESDLSRFDTSGPSFASSGS